MLCYENKSVWQQTAAPGFKPLLLAWSRQRAPGLLPCSSPFRGSSLGRGSCAVFFWCSSAADPLTGMIKSHNRAMGSFIAAGVSEHTVQEKTNLDTGQNQIHRMMLNLTSFSCVVGLSMVVWFRPSRRQSTTQLLAHSSPPVGWGGENITKGLWVETRTGRDHSPVMVTGKTDSILGKNKPI